MQNRYIVLALAALLGAFSCNTREEGGPRSVKFQAVQGDTPVTRTVLQTDGSVFWSPGDAINLYYGASGATRLVSDNQSAVAQTTFSGTLDGLVPNGQDDFWAVYPYDETNYFNGSAVTVSVPGVQPAISGTFAPEAFISMARSKDYTLQFYNLCGGVQFSVTRPGVQAVVFRGNNEEFLAGTVQASFGQDGRPMVAQAVKPMQELRLEASENGFEVGKWYYLVSLPATLSAGYTMTFIGTDGEVLAERVSEKPVTIKRSVWGILADADDVAEPITASRYLTFTSEGSSSIYLQNQDNAPVLYYSRDAVTWNLWDYSALYFRAGDPLYLCGDNPDGFNFSKERYSFFLTNGDNISISGDIMSLLNKDEELLAIPNAYCFYYLFTDCMQLTSGPSLPATTLTANCYDSMYDGSSLQVAPALPARTLAPSCYNSMFVRCSRLTSVPETLPATTLTESCYANMFANCSSLATAPVLPATTLAEGCYYGMFSNSSLSAAPSLPATNLAPSCYDSMFYRCSSLEQAPQLPATELVTNCYKQMFGNCRQLVSAPDLPAQTLAEGCYTEMFYFCENLQYVKCLAMGIRGGTENWLSFVAAQGTFVKAADMNDWSVGASGIPEGWTVRIAPETVTASKYLTFTSEGTTTISMAYSEGNVVPSFSPVLYYSSDRETWTQWDLSPLTFTANAPLYMCGDNPETVTGYANGGNNYRFSSSGDLFAVSGDAMSLLNRNEDLSVAPSSCFSYLFSECTNLTLAPSLPATTLESGCYQDMFDGCTSLREAPELSAMTLAEDCYRGMFARCTTLTAAPVLPATTLKEGCYRDMFQSCGELTAAPELPAATLVKECYRGMFDGCFHLSYVKCLATDISAEDCLKEWLYNVSSTGTFVKAADMDAWPRSENGIPQGWGVVSDGETPSGDNEGTGEEDWN